MFEGVGDHDRGHLLGHQTGQPLVQSHAHPADAGGIEADSGAETEFLVGRFQDVNGADGCVEAVLDEADDVGERLLGVVRMRRESAALLKGERRERSSRWLKWAHGCSPPPMDWSGMVIRQNHGVCNGVFFRGGRFDLPLHRQVANLPPRQRENSSQGSSENRRPLLYAPTHFHGRGVAQRHDHL